VKVLVTGGAGFIGSFLTQYYEKSGETVTILDNFTTGSLQNLDAIDFKGISVRGDIRDSYLVDELVRESELVIHMAAALGVSNIMNSTMESISVNITGSEIVLKAAAKHKKRLLIASTSEIYGKNPKQPLSEEDDRVVGTPQNIRWSYSDAKAIEEAMARTLNINDGLEVTTIRFFNTVGPRQTGRYGMVIPKLVRSALKNEDLLVHGDGSQSRVFCHVEDAISAVTQLVETKKSIGEVYNVGGIGEVTINELAERIILRAKSNSKIRFIPYKEVYPVGFEDMQRRVPDISKISSFIGWKPSRDLDQIIDDVVEYQSRVLDSGAEK
jgi:UDP-glucose 4-epimerase